MGASLLWYREYERWQAKAMRLAEQLHQVEPFALVHQVNYCGFRNPGLGWRLGAPFVWGPIGGTQYFPWRFLRFAGVSGAAREVTRNVINYFQLRYSPRVREAARCSTRVIAATRLAQDDLLRLHGVPSDRELETGLDCPISAPRGPRQASAPLRILAAGRLQPWKGVPLLLHALAQLPASVSYEVRVLGEGPCGEAWRRLAQRLGVGHRVEFVGWPTYEETLPHYRWADVLTFTSLRDTSGTGLLESLAAGAPIIGLDHQGAADVMTDDCAIRVPVRRPQQVIEGIASGLVRLAESPDEWLRMSRAAQERAKHFCWGARQESTNALYRRVIEAASPAGAESSPTRSTWQSSPLSPATAD